MKVIVTNKDSLHDLQTDLLELAVIMYNLRKFTKIWHEHFGAVNRKKMNEWQAKADEWLYNHIEQPNTKTAYHEK